MGFSRKRLRVAISGVVSGSALSEQRVSAAGLAVRGWQVSAVGFAVRGYLNMTILRDDWKPGAVIR